MPDLTPQKLNFAAGKPCSSTSEILPGEDPVVDLRTADFGTDWSGWRDFVGWENPREHGDGYGERYKLVTDIE